jgi:hypothetical protein
MDNNSYLSNSRYVIYNTIGEMSLESKIKDLSLADWGRK